MKKKAVPFNQSVVLPNHLQSFSAAFNAGGPFSGNGPYTKKCEHLLEKQTKVSVRLVTSATHALEMMALLLDVKPGDELILPSYTFVSAANAFALRGAVLRFADNDEHGNILPTEIERLVTPKTKAVMAMNYAGGSADLDRCAEICKAAGIVLLEDAAQSVGAKYKGRPLGTIATVGCFSFHDTKNISAGEGGALLLNDSKFLERAEILREKGTNRAQFFQGLVDKYTWVDLGSSYILSDLNAAYLLPQLEQVDMINRKRLDICASYRVGLEDEIKKKDIRFLEIPKHNEPNGHIFGLIFPQTESRNLFISKMRERGVSCTFHYVPLHKSPVGATFYKGKPESLPGCETLAACLVRLPLYFNMSDEDKSWVIEQARAVIREF